MRARDQIALAPQLGSGTVLMSPDLLSSAQLGVIIGLGVVAIIEGWRLVILWIWRELEPEHDMVTR
jgi:hypothetical protein